MATSKYTQSQLAAMTLNEVHTIWCNTRWQRADHGRLAHAWPVENSPRTLCDKEMTPAFRGYLYRARCEVCDQRMELVKQLRMELLQSEDADATL
jgi:hypothetical protein